MVLVLLGLVVGLAVALGPLAWLQPTADAASGTLVTTSAELMTRGINAVPGAGDHPNVVMVFSVLVGVVTPGLIALALAWCANTSGRSGRSTAAAALVVVAVAAFFFVPFAQALLAAAVSGAAAVLIVSPLGRAGRVAAMALATTLAVDVVRTVVAGDNASVTYATGVLGDISRVQAPEFWAMCVSVVALAPFVAAVWMLVHGTDRSGAPGV